MRCFVFSLFCVILIYLGVYSQDKGISKFARYLLNIKIKVLDSSGKESSLNYDGGSVELTCWYTSMCSNGVSIELQVTNRTKGAKSTKLVTRNDTTVQHRISINSATLNQVYVCKCGSKISQGINIRYALCDPRSVKPRKVCPKLGEYCHITGTGLADCRSLNEGNCYYASNLLANMYDPPKFSTVCINKVRLGQHEPTGLCSTLADRCNPPAQFLAVDAVECMNDFKLYICKNNCSKKRQLIMSGWSFIDLKSSFSLSMYWRVRDRHAQRSIEQACTIGGDRAIIPVNSTLVPGKRNFTHITGFAEQLKKLSTPTIADIVCTVTPRGRTDVQFQTNLLLFRSDTDWHYNITHKKMGLIGDQAIYRVTINVTAAEGLFVCATVWIKKCTPSGTRTSGHMETIISLRQGHENSTAGFYIALFASSPKLEYVLLHDKIQGFNLTTQQAKGKSSQLGKSLQLGLIIPIIVVSIVIIVAVVVSGTIWWREEYGNC